jgi:hypothetical protein
MRAGQLDRGLAFPLFGFLGKMDPCGFSFTQVYLFFDSD